jgi:aldehyde dehydrogenase (NAD+)
MSQEMTDFHSSVSLNHQLFERLNARASLQRKLSVKERIKRLDALYEEIWRRRDDLKQAMWADFQKPPQEVDLTEIFVLKQEIKAIKKGLKRWMRPQRVPGRLSLIGSSSWIRPEAKGVALIIAPWNYPMQLLFRPLVSALAAGCTVMLKPSEYTVNTAQVVAEIVAEVFDACEVSLVQGGVDTATELLTLPFNHMFFTGSPEVGKVVMSAAAKIPCSVTLELGGKSPVIIDKSADIKATAKRIAWAKLSNAGQICVAPDYILVHESKRDELVEALKQAMDTLYPNAASKSRDYQRIVHPRHAERIQALIVDAKERGAKVVKGGQVDVQACEVAPTLLVDVPGDSHVLQEEIFGPILPILTWNEPDEAIAFILARPTPLALYLYGSRRRLTARFVDEIPSGGVSINNSVIHVSSTDLPFGGLGSSGIGSSNGEFGFREFTHFRGMYAQRWSGLGPLLMPPYTSKKTRLVDFALRWL